MPVIEHDVHEKVRVSSAFRYSLCEGTPAPGYMVKDGLVIETVRVNGEVLTVSRYRMKYIEHRMSTECRYDKSLTDSACAGCRERGMGEEYDRKIREEGK